MNVEAMYLETFIKIEIENLVGYNSSRWTDGYFELLFTKNESLISY